MGPSGDLVPRACLDLVSRWCGGGSMDSRGESMARGFKGMQVDDVDALLETLGGVSAEAEAMVREGGWSEEGAEAVALVGLGLAGLLRGGGGGGGGSDGGAAHGTSRRSSRVAEGAAQCAGRVCAALARQGGAKGGAAQGKTCGDAMSRLVRGMVRGCAHERGYVRVACVRGLEEIAEVSKHDWEKRDGVFLRRELIKGGGGEHDGHDGDGDGARTSSVGALVAALAPLAAMALWGTGHFGDGGGEGGGSEVRSGARRAVRYLVGDFGVRACLRGWCLAYVEGCLKRQGVDDVGEAACVAGSVACGSLMKCAALSGEERQGLVTACLAATGVYLAGGDGEAEGDARERWRRARLFCGGIFASAGMPGLLADEEEEEDEVEEDEGEGEDGARRWLVALTGAVARGVGEGRAGELDVGGAVEAAFPGTSLDDLGDAAAVGVGAFARAAELAVGGTECREVTWGARVRADREVQEGHVRALDAAAAWLVPPEQPFETCENAAAYGGEVDAGALGKAEAFAGASVSVLRLARCLVSATSGSALQRAERQRGTAAQVLLAAGLHMPLRGRSEGAAAAYAGAGVRGWASPESGREAEGLILALAARGEDSGRGERGEVEGRLERVLSVLRPRVLLPGDSAAKWQLLWALGSVEYPSLDAHVGELMACVLPLLDAASPLGMAVGCECWALVLAKASATQLRTLGFAPLVVRSLSLRAGGTEEGLVLLAVPTLVDTARQLQSNDGSREADEVIGVLVQALGDHWDPRVSDRQAVAAAVMDALAELVAFVGLRASRIVGDLLPLAAAWPKDARRSSRCALAGLALLETLLTQAWPRAHDYAVAVFTDLALAWRRADFCERHRGDGHEAEVKARAVAVAALLAQITGDLAGPVLHDFLAVPDAEQWAAQVLGQRSPPAAEPPRSLAAV